MSTLLDNRYDLLERIGDGGMATVYRAKDTLLDRYVAIKILHPQFNNDNAFVTSFRKEAQGAAKLSHPNIVNIYDVGCYENQNYIVMEYVKGETLKEKISREGRLPIPLVIQIAEEVASALEHAHANNLVHCDIKPHNILINSNGHIKVTDFGIARVASSTTMTFTGAVVGTVHYFSPEQAKGTTITTKSDVYSLGVLMYEMLSGQLPFTGETAVSIAIKHLNDAPKPLHEIHPDIPPILEAIVMKALTKDPENRFTSTEMLAELHEAKRMLGTDKLSARLNMETTEDPFATRIMTADEVQKIADASYEPVTQHTQSTPTITQQTRAPKKKKNFFSVKYIITLLVIIVLGLGVGAFLSYGNFWSGKTVEVPNVVGMTQSQAEETLKAENLRVEIAETYDATVPVGKVVSQTPEAGKTVKENRLITIYISKGGEALVMPNLVGMTENDAKSQLQNMDITAQIKRVFSDQPEGTVLQQSIPANGNVTKGSSVDLVVSKGQENKTVKMTNVVGLTVDQATDVLKAQGLRVSSSASSGKVTSQSIDPGTEVSTGTTVVLGVSDTESTSSESSASEKTQSEPKAKEKAQPSKAANNVVVPQRQKN